MKIKVEPLFGIHGYFSDGDGMIGFYGFDLRKIKKLYQHPKALMLMSYLIMNLVEFCYSHNGICDQIYLTLDEIVRLDLSESEAKELLEILKKNELIEFDKLEGKSCWIITLL